MGTDADTSQCALRAEETGVGPCRNRQNDSQCRAGNGCQQQCFSQQIHLFLQASSVTGLRLHFKQHTGAWVTLVIQSHS